MAFPAVVLFARLGKGKAVEKQPWACYLPPRLQQRGGAASAALGAAAATPASMDCGLAEEILARSHSDSSSSAPSAFSFGQQPAAAAAAPVAATAPGGPLGLAGHVWALARDVVGCREVQHALEGTEDYEARAALAAELRGHVWEAVQCPHANHVVQKCLTTLRPGDFQFVLDELMGRDPVAAAQHKYGCRIIKRLLEHGSPAQKHCLTEVLLANACAVSKHPYGTFVVQHLLHHIGDGPGRRRLAESLQANVRVLASDPHGCAVLHAAFAGGLDHCDRQALARTVLAHPGLITGMACIRHGHLATQELLRILDGAEQDAARQELARKCGQLRASRYGRSLAAQLGAEATEQADLHAMLALRNAGA